MTSMRLNIHNVRNRQRKKILDNRERKERTKEKQKRIP